MENPLGYRHKVIATFQKQKNRIVAGQYEPKTHKVVVNKENMAIEHPKAQTIIQTLVTLIKSFKYDVFDEKSGYGLFRHVLLRFSYASNEVLVVLVVSELNFAGKKNFARALVKKHPEISSIVLSANKRKTSVVLGDKFETLYGPGFILDKINDISFKLSPTSFYQVNPQMTQLLYSRAIACADLKPTDMVIDAYCGIGTIGLLASRFSGRVIGIELNKQAVLDAWDNAKFNRIQNIKFVHGDATQELSLMVTSNKRADVVFMDPTRDGSTKEFCDSVVKLAPAKIVYISCNPVTCVRDLAHFEKYYTVDRLILVDQFPLTKHVECIALLTRK